LAGCTENLIDTGSQKFWMRRYKKTLSVSHAKLVRIAVGELEHEGYSADKISVDVDFGGKRVDVFALGKRDTIVECKSFKHTNDYTQSMKTSARKVLVQPYFDVDEMWLVLRGPSNRYKVIRVLRPED